MTKLQCKAVAKLISDAREISVRVSTTEIGESPIVFTTKEEAERLANSEDFQKGWEMCHLKFVQSLQYICEADNESLEKWIRER